MRNILEVVVRASIIIPVFNKGEPVKGCLKALGDTLPEGCEVIVVDCAPGDGAAAEFEPLGKELFTDVFSCVRGESALGLGACMNLGTGRARGEYLVFLCADILPRPGWFEPLLKDFETFPDIAATGPVLLHPPTPGLGATVRHLGLYVTPERKAGRLYEGIPATSPLVGKRRFFQGITADCMVMPKNLFVRFNGFDERCKNGDEIVDLCARLANNGYKMTVNADSAAYHHTPRAPGHNSPEGEGHKTFGQNPHDLLTPDWHNLLENDGLEMEVGKWLVARPRVKGAQDLQPVKDRADIVDRLTYSPFDEKLFIALARSFENDGDFDEALAVLHAGARIESGPAIIFEARRIAVKSNNLEMTEWANRRLTPYAAPLEEYEAHAAMMESRCRELGIEKLADLYGAWLAERQEFYLEGYLPFKRKLHIITSKRSDRRISMKIHFVSVVIPAYNYADFLPYTLENVLVQGGVETDIIIVDDGSTDNTRDVARAFGSNVRYIYQENQGLSAARNTGLKAAISDYLVFLDADDLLYPDTLRSQCETLEENPQAHLAVCLNQFFSCENPAGPFRAAGYLPLARDNFDIHICRRTVAPVHSFMIRTNFAREVGGFDTGLKAMEDYDYWLRCMAAGAKLASNYYGLALYRRHGRNMSGLGAKQFAYELMMREKVQELLAKSAFPRGHKPDGWFAHALHCLNMTRVMAERGTNLSPKMAEFGLQAIKRAAKEMSLNKKQWKETDSSRAILQANVLALLTETQSLIKLSIPQANPIQDILLKLFPELDLPPSARQARIQSLLKEQYCPQFLVTDFMTWETVPI